MRLSTRLRKETDGIAAVEFALLLPILLVLLLGSLEIANALVVQNKTRKIAASIDHLITKAEGLNAGLVQDTLQASGMLIEPFRPERLTIGVTYSYIDAHGETTERWTQIRGEADGVPDAELPPEYAELRDVGFLQTRVRYDHRATFPLLFFETLEMNAESIVRPRPGAPLTCSDC